jgi:hypothetical protein
MIARFLRWLRCLLCRHEYSPRAEWRCTSYNPRRWWPRYRWQARFRCRCCSTRTRWMYRAAAERFIAAIYSQGTP